MRTRPSLTRLFLVLGAVTALWAAPDHVVAIAEQPPSGTVALKPAEPTVPADAPLLQTSDLVHQGTFRLPAEQIAGSSFEYGGTSIAFNPEHNSLFIVGHDHQQHVAEISIPVIRRVPAIRDLATATVLQPFTDATEGRLGLAGPNNVKIGGMHVHEGQLYLTAYMYYDGAGTQVLSHYVSGLDLSVKGDVRGPFQVGKLGAGFVSGYFASVPHAWQEALGGPVLNGNCCLPVIGRTSYGPALFTIDPTTIGGKTPAPAAPLVYYNAAHPLLEPGAKGDGWGNTSTLFNGTTEVRGVVFPEGTRSVLFFGRHGTGTFCYGPGTADRSQAGQPAEGGVDKYCYDPPTGNKGTHAFPYIYQVWAYDAADFAAVNGRTRQAWTVRPYAVWKLDVPFDNENTHLNGAAYDPKTGRIFVSQAFGDGDRPLIHVFMVRASAVKTR